VTFKVIHALQATSSTVFHNLVQQMSTAADANLFAIAMFFSYFYILGNSYDIS